MSRKYIWCGLIIVGLGGAFGDTIVAAIEVNMRLSVSLSGLLMFLPVLYEFFVQHRDPLTHYGITIRNLSLVDVPRKTLLIATILFFASALAVMRLTPELASFANSNQAARPGGAGQALTRASWVLAIPLGLIVTAAVALNEEIWFRGVIQMKLLQVKPLVSLNPTSALVAQAVLFGLAHALPFAGLSGLTSIALIAFVSTMLAALAFGYLAYRTHSVLPGWYVHWGANFLAFCTFRLGLY